jgi:hypothetical protein
VKGDIFLLARALRLARYIPRKADFQGDRERYERAVGSLRTLIGEEGTDRELTSFLEGEDWLIAASSDKATDQWGGRFDEWPLLLEQKSHEYTLWCPNPRRHRAPEWLAAAEVVMRLKRRLIALEPSGDPYGGGLDTANVRRLVQDREELQRRLMRFANDLESSRKALLGKIGLENAYQFETRGNPQVRVLVGKGEDVRFEIAWEKGEASFTVDRSGGAWRGRPLSQVGADIDALVYQEVRAQIEQSLGSSLSSRYWVFPELLASWVW